MGVYLGELIDKDIAVNCRTSEEASMLLEQLINLFPERCICWSLKNNQWSLYREHTCYAMYRDEDSDPKRLVYSPDHFFNDLGYEVISFGDLMTEMDLGEINTDNISIEFLFGAEEESV